MRGGEDWAPIRRDSRTGQSRQAPRRVAKDRRQTQRRRQREQLHCGGMSFTHAMMELKQEGIRLVSGRSLRRMGTLQRSTGVLSAESRVLEVDTDSPPVNICSCIAVEPGAGFTVYRFYCQAGLLSGGV